MGTSAHSPACRSRGLRVGPQAEQRRPAGCRGEGVEVTKDRSGMLGWILWILSKSQCSAPVDLLFPLSDLFYLKSGLGGESERRNKS